MAGIIRKLRAEEIDCRIGTIKENGLSLLLYKDARCDMNILDETFGQFGWQRHHSRDNANCTVSVYDEEKAEWIEKEDTGTESNTEAEKGLASDSFKRACFNWGIGRELYTAPFIWIGSDKCTIEKSERGKLYCYDKFSVAEIGYNERSEISKLVIANMTTGVDVFTYPRVPQIARNGKAEDKAETAEDPIKPYYRCEGCGKAIPPMNDSKGKPVNLRAYEARSREKFGKLLCVDCASLMQGMKQ